MKKHRGPAWKISLGCLVGWGLIFVLSILIDILTTSASLDRILIIISKIAISGMWLFGIIFAQIACGNTMADVIQSIKSIPKLAILSLICIGIGIFLVSRMENPIMAIHLQYYSAIVLISAGFLTIITMACIAGYIAEKERRLTKSVE